MKPQRLPAPSRPEVEAAAIAMIRSQPVFAIGEAEVRGVKMPAFVNAPPDLRFLLSLCDAHGEAEAVVYGDQRWTFAELAQRSRAVAGGLRAIGVKPGDMIAIAMRNYPEWMAAFLGVIAAGGVVAPLNGWWTADELEYALKDCGAKIVFTDRQRAERLSEAKSKLGLTLVSRRDNAPEADMTLDELMARAAGADKTPPVIKPDDPFAVFYTSGSTGEPKGAVLTHRGAITTLLSFALVQGAVKAATGGDEGPFGFTPVVLLVLPLFHCTASHAIFMLSLVTGRKMVMMHKWSAEDAMDLIDREGVTNFVGVPTMSHELMLAAERAGRKLKSLIDFGNGGAKRPPAHVTRLADVFPHAWSSNGYGLTETNALGTYCGMEDYQARPGAAGRAVPPVTAIRIAGADGAALPPGETGEVWIRSPAVFAGYLNQPEATADMMTSEGWLKTGDLGVMDEEGFLTIVDRIKDIIIRGGENVSCLEVEAALCAHPGVLEAAVFAVPDERLGERVGAAILPAPQSGATEADLRDFLKMRIAAFKQPDHYWMWTEPLPRGGTGKIDKRAIRSRFQARSAAA